MPSIGSSLTAAAATAVLLVAVSAQVWSQEPAPLPQAATPTQDVPAVPQHPPGDAKPKAGETRTADNKSGEVHVPFRRTAFSGNEMIMGVFNTLPSDCIALTRPDVRVVIPPANGTLRFDAILAAVERPPGDVREKCNGKRTISVGIFYKSKPGFVGADAATIDVDFRQGFIGRFSYDIEVR